VADNATLQKRYFPVGEKKYPQIYAYRLKSEPDELKVGFTTKRDVRDRINEQLYTSNQDYILEFFADAVKENGESFNDHPVHKWLEEHGAIRVPRKAVFAVKGGRPPEIFRNCSKKDVEAAVKSIVTGKDFSASRTNTYGPRAEQQAAMDKTMEYFKQQKLSEPTKTPKFLWNAKMRFGKTYTSLKMAREMGLSHVLIITFKVEVKESWRDELNGHVDFTGWQFIDIKEKNAVQSIDKSRPYVAFGSFQDILGRNKLGGLKTKNEWIHTDNWDLVIFDEYHYGSWRDRNKGQFDTGEASDMELLDENVIPITADYMLFLSGTPFRAINTGEFLEDQIYNWTYGDEQEAKANWDNSKGNNPYASMPEMILMTYQLPEVCTQIALKGDQNEFDLNEFFRAECPKDEKGKDILDEAKFVHANEVQRWLDIIRGKADISTEHQKAMGATTPVLPFLNTSLVSIINHTLWYMHSVASCYAMKNLLKAPNNAFYGNDYEIIVAAGDKAGSGSKALVPVREAMRRKDKTITITCQKLTTGVTVREWSAIFMLSNISTPESYFQSSFRVQSAWTIASDDADKPATILKPKCYVFDFAPNRALRQLSEYACGLNPDVTQSAEDKVAEFIKFLPVLAFDGTGMYPVNATEILDFVASGTTAALLARKWDSALLVNVSNEMLQAIINDDDAKEAIMNIEGFRTMNSDVFETIVNRSDALKDRKTKEKKDDKENKKEKKEITEEEKELKSQRKQIQENLRKFATRIPLFMYLTDEREVCLQDVITKVEPALFKKVTGIKVSDFEKLVTIGVFNSAAMNEAVAAFRRYEESSLTYAGIDKHYGEKVGLWDISVKRDELLSM
jgi:hypothetical protein